MINFIKRQDREGGRGGGGRGGGGRVCGGFWWWWQMLACFKRKNFSRPKAQSRRSERFLLLLRIDGRGLIRASSQEGASPLTF